MPEPYSPEKTITMHVDFDGSPERLWTAWSDPKQFAKWQSLDEAPVTNVSHEFRAGGKWKYTMPMPNGYDYVGEGSFIEIVPLQKIVMTAAFEFVDEVAELVFLFELKQNKTHLTFSNVFQTEAYCKKQLDEMGFTRRWERDFNRLRKTLKG